MQSKFSEFIQAILFLCQKSLALREKKQKKIDEAQEDKDCESGVVYDEDEDDGEELGFGLDDYEEEEDGEDWNLDSDDDEKDELYDNKLDKVDDILFVQE